MRLHVCAPYSGLAIALPLPPWGTANHLKLLWAGTNETGPKVRDPRTAAVPGDCTGRRAHVMATDGRTRL